MCDNFFNAAFGGSFLNHQFLIAAQAPVYPNAPANLQATLASDGQLALDPVTGKISHDGTITPIGGASFAVPGATFAGSGDCDRPICEAVFCGSRPARYSFDYQDN
jgi:hypothetical protein